MRRAERRAVRRAVRRAEHCIELCAGVYADIRIGVYRDDGGDVRTDDYRRL